MRKHMMLLPGGFLITVAALAQQSTPSVIASAGDVSKNGNLYLEWTLGEPVVETATAHTYLLTQGFHQPFLRIGYSSATTAARLPFSVVIMPNPVHYTCKTFITKQSPITLFLELTDITGRKLFTAVSKATIDVVDLDFSPYTSGTYVLTVRDATGGLFKTFKIIKAQ